MQQFMAPARGGRVAASVPDSCWVLTSRDRPFEIKMASDSWHALWRFPSDEAVGKPMAILQAEGSNAAASKGLMCRFRADGSAATARCTNVTKDGELRSHDLLLVSHVAGLLGISTNIVTLEQPLSEQQQAQDALIVPLPASKRTIGAILRDVARKLSPLVATQDSKAGDATAGTLWSSVSSGDLGSVDNDDPILSRLGFPSQRTGLADPVLERPSPSEKLPAD